ncbi:MAG: glycosyltransferase family 2 protein [bacterium]
MKPKVSAIIPTYNRAHFLREAIESVMAQTLTSIELIIIDDGSDDHTREVLSEYAGRIRCLPQENKGVSAARNFGIKTAQGEYIAFLDSDDLWHPQKCALQSDFLDKHKSFCLCYTEEIWIRNGTRVNPCSKHAKYSGYIFDKCLPLCIISPSSAMIRASLLKSEGGFDETLPACEDYDLWLRLTARYPVYLISTPLITKRGGHQDQLSRTIKYLDKYRIQSLEKLMNHTALTPSQWQSAWSMLRQKCMIYGNGCMKHKKYEEADYYLRLPDTLIAKKNEHLLN